MTRSLFYVAWAASTILAAACLAMFLYGALALNGRSALGGTVLLIPSIAAITATVVYTADNGRPKARPSLSRDSRRRLREEKERIAFDAEVARMEKEAGLS